MSKVIVISTPPKLFVRIFGKCFVVSIPFYNLCGMEKKIKCEYYSIVGLPKCKNFAKWRVLSNAGLDKSVCTCHKNKIVRNGSHTSYTEIK